MLSACCGRYCRAPTTIPSVLMFFCFFFKFINFYLFFLAVLGLRFRARAFSSYGERGPPFIAVRGPLTIAASLVAEHRLQTRRLSNCGSRAQPLRGMWDPPGPGLEPVSPALAGRLSTTAPPGKPRCSCFYPGPQLPIASIYDSAWRSFSLDTKALLSCASISLACLKILSKVLLNVCDLNVWFSEKVGRRDRERKSSNGPEQVVITDN